MDFYKTAQTVRFPAGTVLVLSEAQFNARRHLLNPRVDGATLAQHPVEFKAGEIVGLGTVPLALTTQLELVAFDDDDGEMLQGSMLGWSSEQGCDSEEHDQLFDSMKEGEKIEGIIETRPDATDPGVQLQPESGDLTPTNADTCTDGLNTLQAVLVDTSASEPPAETVKPAKKQAK